MCIGHVQPRTPLPEVNWNLTSELVNPNHLIEDVCSALSAAKAHDTVLELDLAADLPFIEGDYRLLRRLLLNLLNDLHGVISLGSRSAQLDRAYLTQHFPGANLPEGPYVLIQVIEKCGDTGSASTLAFRSQCQFLFPCAINESTRGPQTDAIEPTLVHRDRVGARRTWLFMRVQHAQLELQSTQFTTSNSTEVSQAKNVTTTAPEGSRRRGQRLGNGRTRPRGTDLTTFPT